jgi:hypothetical protein
MIYHYLIGVGALLLLSTAWLGVQRAWRRSFPDAGADPDALAGRLGCHGCSDSSDCHRGPESGACKAQEEMP